MLVFPARIATKLPPSRLELIAATWQVWSLHSDIGESILAGYLKLKISGHGNFETVAGRFMSC